MKRLLPLIALVAIACGSETDAPTKSEPTGPVFAGKADVADKVDLKADLDFEGTTEFSTAFTEDFEFHAVRFMGSADAKVRVEVTQRGTARGLDTAVFLYGPRDDRGKYGQRIAMDDDNGYGKLSRLDATLPADGQYLAVVGTYQGAGRGHYRIELSCLGDSCLDVEVPAACPESMSGYVADCVGEYLVDSDYEGTRNEGFETCLGDDSGDLFDQACDSRWSAPEAWCAAGVDAFEVTIVPACRASLAAEYPKPRDPLPMAAATVPELLEEATYDHDCEYCSFEANAYKVGDVEGADLTWILETLQQDDPHAQEGFIDATGNFRHGLEELGGDTDALMEAIYAEAGSRTFQAGEISWSWYAAAGAEEWVTIYVAWFDTGYVVALDVRAGET